MFDRGSAVRQAKNVEEQCSHLGSIDEKFIGESGAGYCTYIISLRKELRFSLFNRRMHSLINLRNKMPTS